MPSSAVKKAAAQKKDGGPLKPPHGYLASTPPSNLVVLYSDNRHDSIEAERRLQSLGVQLDIERAETGTEVFPTAVYRGWIYRGLDKIDILRDQITFQSRRKTGVK